MNNLTIRRAAAEKSVKLWQIADALGIADTSFSRKLRHELPVSEQERILHIIAEISSRGGCE